jgi:L,D-peptidoglycan transpeptidase YkuD (ErfK/YbiS/YcfS/YnhG family)
MIIINKSGFIRYKNLKFKCTLGRAGIGKKKVEGDNITPVGIYKILNVYYRSDRIKKLNTKFKIYQIKKDMGWCDDPKSKKYNQLIKIPSNYNHEKLYRKDNVYDLIVVLDYNKNPTIKNKGSAIFIHLTKNYKIKTAGCIGLKKKNLLKLLSQIKTNIKIKICF